MKTIKRLWGNIPRKARIAMNLAAIALVLAVTYVVMGCPAFTPTQHFRRLEKANLVGPSEIIEIVALPNSEYDHMVVADDGDAVIVYCYNSDNYLWDKGTFIYREKSEGITVFPMPSHHFGPEEEIVDLPVLLFHDHPGAVRAELELTLGESLGVTETKWEHGGTVMTVPFEKTYYLEAQRDTDGYFRFHIHAEIPGEEVERNGIVVWEPTSKEWFALRIFSRMTAENRMYLHEHVPAVVRLYDRNDALITEEHLTIRSVAGERYTLENGTEP